MSFGFSLPASEASSAYVAVRPSGTEPKVKYYMFAYAPPTADMYSSIDAVQHRLDAIEQDLK